MFDNCNPNTNGEYLFHNHIKPNINVIFDVGCRADSDFIYFEHEVHYFDPVEMFIKNLSGQTNNNKKAFFNPFGLSNKEESIFYYPRYQSFCDRNNITYNVSDSNTMNAILNSSNTGHDGNKLILNVKKAKTYMIENNISTIDFLKIDTEGYELHVLQGFEDYLKNVKIVQFEYGGTFSDINIKLIDVINHLEKNGFHKFAYLTQNGAVLLTDYTDHYQYCNIVCINKNSDYIPY